MHAAKKCLFQSYKIQYYTSTPSQTVNIYLLSALIPNHTAYTLTHWNQPKRPENFLVFVLWYDAIHVSTSILGNKLPKTSQCIGYCWIWRFGCELNSQEKTLWKHWENVLNRLDSSKCGSLILKNQKWI